MPRWIIPAIVIAIVFARSAVFLLSPESYFDSDQAIVGLMAKHLSELRAFPVFLYGQTYMLGVEAWLAAPLFVLFGVSATVLKLPLLAMNLATALLLVFMLRRDMDLSAPAATVAALPFILPSVGLSAVLMDSGGGSLEPFLYVVLLWLTRQRPLLLGLVFGIGFINREFTVYGLAALVAVDALDRTLFTRAAVLRWGRTMAVAVAVFVAIQGLKQFSSGGGPGTTIRDTFTRSNNLAELAGRMCISPAKTMTGAGRLVSVHWPALFGTGRYPLTMFSIESGVTQGMAGSSWLPAALALLSIAGIAGSRVTGVPGSPVRPRVAQYLILTGVFSVAGYLFARCGEVSFYTMRYDLLSVLAIVGLSAWFLATARSTVLRGAWSVVFVAWMAVAAVPHVRFAYEYATHPPMPAKEQLIHVLQAQGVRYGTADYWLAYYIDFRTREEMIFAAESPQRILLYNRIVAEHPGEAVRLSRRSCEGGTALIDGVYRCP